MKILLTKRPVYTRPPTFNYNYKHIPAIINRNYERLYHYRLENILLFVKIIINIEQMQRMHDLMYS